MRLKLDRDYSDLRNGFEFDIDLNSSCFYKNGTRTFVKHEETVNFIPAVYLDVVLNQDTKDILILNNAVKEMDSHKGILVIEPIACPKNTWIPGERYYLFEGENIDRDYLFADFHKVGMRVLLTPLIKRAFVDSDIQKYVIYRDSSGYIVLTDIETKKSRSFNSVERAVAAFNKMVEGS